MSNDSGTAAGVLTLTEFLLARIAEDEAAARDATKWADGWAELDEGAAPWTCQEQTTHVAVAPARVLAECEAKRRIVEGMRPFGPIDDINAPEVLGLLALPYADHPDYREEWRP